MIQKSPPWIAVTQRVVIDGETAERRDALDQRWADLLNVAGLLPLLLPNSLSMAQQLLASLPITGILLTGGNSLLSYGGDAPERDQLEFKLLELSRQSAWPVLGVCRGMQVMQAFCGQSLEPISGHVTSQQMIQIQGQRELVNAYHNWGTRDAGPEFQVWASADDGVVKAIQHLDLPWWGVMWHPERISPFRSQDIRLLRQIFQSD